MAVNRKTSPVGIDIPIDRLQNLLYVALVAQGWTNYESYDRAYKNETANGQVPEFNIDGTDYKEVLFDDNYFATSFFLADNVRPKGELFTTTVSVIFQVNLKELFPSITTHRADEEMHRLIAVALNDTVWGYKLENVTTGISEVYSALEGFDLDSVKWDDMSEFHVVRFDIEVDFDYLCD